MGDHTGGQGQSAVSVVQLEGVSGHSAADRRATTAAKRGAPGCGTRAAWMNARVSVPARVGKPRFVEGAFRAAVHRFAEGPKRDRDAQLRPSLNAGPVLASFFGRWRAKRPAQGRD